MGMEAKWTPGPWQHGYSDGSGRVNMNGESSTKSGGTIIALLPSADAGDASMATTVVNGGLDVWGVPVGVVGDSQAEAHANADLIAEAGTVATETGLTPRQLADQRAELLAALSDLVRQVDLSHAVDDHGHRLTNLAALALARAAIAHAKGG